MDLTNIPRDILPLFLDYDPEITINDIQPYICRSQKIRIFVTIKYYQIIINSEFCFQLCDPANYDKLIGSKLDKFILSVKSGIPYCKKSMAGDTPAFFGPSTEFFQFDGKSITLENLKFGPVFFPAIIKFIGKLKPILQRHRIDPEIDKIYEYYEKHILKHKIDNKYYPYDFPNYEPIPVDKLNYYFQLINKDEFPGVDYDVIQYPLMQNNSKIFCYAYQEDNYYNYWALIVECN